MAVKSISTTDKIISDLLDCINALKEQFHEENNPITDENIPLQKLCAKLEFALQLGLKEKTSILGNKKDYWDYLCQCLASRKSVHDGIRYVKLKSEVKTSLGKGRAFLRFCLVHSCLADSLQRCFVHEVATRDWYQEHALALQKEKWSCLVSSLYDLSDVQFDLSPDCFDLDISWPTFSRRGYEQRFAWKPPSRSVSISSLNSQIQMEHPLGHQSGSDFPDLEEQDYSEQLDGMRLELAQSESRRKELEKKVLDLESVEENLRSRVEELQTSALPCHNLEQIQTDDRIDSLKNGVTDETDVYSIAVTLGVENCDQKNNITAFQMQIEGLILENEKLISVISECNSSNEILKSKNEQLVFELQTVENDNAVKSARLCEMSEAILQLENQLQGYQDNFMDIESSKIEALKNLSEVKNYNISLIEGASSVSSMNDALKKEITILSSEMSTMCQVLSKTNLENDRFSSYVSDLEKKLTVADAQLDIASKNIQELETKVANLNEKSNDTLLMSKITDLEMRNISLSQELQSTSNNFQCQITSLCSEKDELCQLIKKLEGEHDDLLNQLREKNEALFKSSKSLSQLEHVGSVFSPLVIQQESVAGQLHQKFDNLCVTSEKLSTDIKVLASILFCIAKRNFVTVDFLNENSAAIEKSHIPDKSYSEPESVSSSLVALVSHSARTVSKLKELYLKNDRVEMVLQTCQLLCSDLIGLAREHKNKLALENFDLQGTKIVVDTLAKEHSKLRTAEAILKYELREKKKLLSTLRHQLESTREEWNRNRLKTAQSEIEWHNLREEFASRHKQSSEESGFVDDRPTEDTTSDHSDVSSTVPIESVPEESVVDDNYQVPSTSSAVPSPSPPSSSCECAESSESFAPPRSRLDILEEQYQLLYVSLLRSSKRSEVLEERLGALLENADSFSGSSHSQNITSLPEATPEVGLQTTDGNLSENEEVLEPATNEDLSQSDISFESSPDSDQAVLGVADSEESINTASSCDILSKEEEVYLQSGNVDENGNEDSDKCESLGAAEEPLLGFRKKTLENFVIRMKDEKMARNAKEALLRSQIQVLLTEKLDLESKVLDLQQEKQQVWNKESEFRKRAEFIFRQERDSFESKLTALNQERADLTKAVEILKCTIQESQSQLLEAKNTLQESRQELSEKEAVLNQQIETLKFQMSSEAMKYERAMKHYNEQEIGIADMKERVMNQEQLIETLEDTLREAKDERRAEREHQWEDLEELKVSLATRDEECSAMNEELKRTTRELDETRKALGNLQSTSQEAEKELTATINRLELSLVQMKNDNEELKMQIIKLTKDKDVLWKRSEALSQLQFSPTRDRWMSDSEVTECLSCKSVFSFTLRKHHCRLCGRIFCHTCANHWVMMASSSRRTRICTECYSEHIEKTSGEVSQLTGGEQEGSEEEATDAAAAIKIIPARAPRASSQDSSSVDSLPISHRRLSSTSAVEALEVNNNNDCEGETSQLEQTFLSEDSNKMEFDVISDEEIARSLSACSPYSPAPSPVSSQETELQTSCTRTIQDILLNGSEGVSGEIWVNAGSSYGIPVLLDQENVILIWEFSSDPKSIAFSVMYKEENSSEGPATEVLLKTTHVRSHLRPVQGHLIAKHSGLYILVFSNNFSRFIAKKVSYTLKIQNSDENCIPE